MSRLAEAVGLGLVLGALHGASASAAPVTTNSETTTTVTETIKQVDYSTGTSYTTSGVNVTHSGTPGPTEVPGLNGSANWSIVEPGGAFQYSETVLGPGISRETFIERETTVFTVTNSISVFTQ